ncbi:MAG: bifunctional methylenetetrahydrofolate dehydrogenase/methenyltetrahydrofolate cyclohydrolase FolD [Candidatus Sumerlaeia bacterium]|nr:bifunctional methylenetetrahydrofolate dehydrogenase/methenyltetrahydrofolate cyclohydrolase FolD [Candidatus Sumerlaeia bacterium]
MPAELIDGKAIAATIRADIARQVAERQAVLRRPPGLAVVLIGDDPASHSYVRSKTQACQEAGFVSIQIDRPAQTTQQELLDIVDGLNANPVVDGILVQLPLPRHIDPDAVIERIAPDKDVDGFHPVNVGRLALGQSGFVPCTPKGIIELLVRSQVPTRGALAVVVGRSNIVGKPVAQLLMRKGPGGDATVVVCHTGTRDLAAMTRQADILIAAAGQPETIDGSMLKPGAVVIDVGVNRIADASRARGWRLVGDVAFDSARQVAARITPVPGGVGPMTIAMLLQNTLESAQRRDPME